MILIVLSLIVCFIIAIRFFYRRPLKYAVKNDTLNKKDCEEVNYGETEKLDIFKKFPIFFSVKLNASQQTGKRVRVQHTCKFKQGEVINETCIVREGRIAIYYKGKVIAVKKSGSLIFRHDLFETRDIKAVVMEESTVYLVTHEVNSYLYYLFLNKVHVNLFCNFFKQIHVFHRYEKDNFECSTFVTNSDTRELIKFMTSLGLYENPFGSSIAENETMMELTGCSGSAQPDIFRSLRMRIGKRIEEMFGLNLDDARRTDFYEQFKLYHLAFDQVLKEEGSDLDKVFIVLHGKLMVDYSYQENPIILIRNNIFGYFKAVFNLNEGYMIRAKENTLIFTVEIDVLRNLGFKPEKMNMNILKDISSLLSLIDYAAEWIRLEPGQILEDSDEPNEHLYIIDDGMMRVYDSKNKEDLHFSSVEYGAGAEFGKRELITENGINEKYIASKTTDIIKLHKNLIFHFMQGSPPFCIEYTKTLFIENKTNKCKTVGIILSDERMRSFPFRLKAVLPNNTLFLTYKNVTTFLGSNMFDTLGELKFMDFIKRNQKKNELIIILLENRFSGLAKNIVNFCDVLLLVGDVEILDKLYCSVELVNLYQNRTDIKSRNDGSIYKNLIYSNNPLSSKSQSQLHKKPNRLEKMVGNIQKNIGMKSPSQISNSNEFKNKNEHKFIRYNKIHHVLSPSSNHFCMKDFERLSRSLLSKRIGLVLSGGGARGIAHIGIIQALEEEGIPIDVVGGTSMGAFIGGLYARKCDNISVFRDTKKLCNKMGSKWRQLFDLTYPVCSLFTGYAFNRMISTIFKDTMIEDLWIDYFCVTTNITTFEEMIHRKGLLWRYVRASMSLAGYLPPLCDPDENNSFNLLLDGGYVNNVPTDVMLSMGVNKVIAIDVGSSVINDHYNYGDTLNGFSAFFNRFFKNRKYLTVNEIQYRLAYITTQKKMRDLCDDRVILLRPDIDDYKTMDFGRFEEIVACGYSYGRRMINEWKKEDRYKELLGMKSKAKRRYSI